MRVETQNAAPSYSAQLVVTGAANFTDSAPTNGASVAATRYITYRPDIFVTSGTSVSFFAIDGTSMSVRLWWYDATLDLWIPNGAAAALTTATSNSTNIVIGCMPGCRFYAQVTANTGATKFAFTIR